jgi:ATP phosphoribosyltransferase regulatory subunit
MSGSQPARLVPLLPGGVCDLLPEGAKRLRELEGAIRQNFGRLGYQEVVLPTIEYLDTFLADTQKDELPAGIFGFLEPFTGRLLALRQDFTPQIARLVASRLKFVQLPMRLLYLGPTFGQDGDGSRLEEHQGGAELIGEAGIKADAEVLGTVCLALKAMGFERFKVYIGDAVFVKSLLALPFQDNATRHAFCSAWRQRNLEALDVIVEKLPIDQQTKGTLVNLPFLVGSRNALKGRVFSSSWSPLQKSLQGVEGLFEALEDVLPEAEKCIELDLGAAPKHAYYTGLFFEVYAEGFPQLIALGGRYDQLFSVFETNVPAVGAGFKLSAIMKVRREPVNF